MKKIFLVFISSIFLISCNSNNSQNNLTEDSNNGKSEKIIISASISPISSIAKYIGGDIFEIQTIIPSSSDPHNFDLSISSSKSLADSSLIFYTGMPHLDEFIEKNSDSNKLINLSESVKIIQDGEYTQYFHLEGLHENEENHKEDEHNHESEDHEDSHNHNINGVDSHIWVGPKNAKLIAEKITEEFSHISPENKELFEENLRNFELEIDELIYFFNENSKLKIENKFLILHDSYNYLFRDLGISDENIILLNESSSGDINAKYLAEITDLVKKENIKFIFKEPAISSKSYDNFIKNNNLQVLDLISDSIEDSKNGYLNSLDKNINSLLKIYE